MNKAELKNKADKLRADVLQMVTNADSGHPGGALGMADVITALYYRFLNDRPEDPNWDKRDRFILSNGHTCPLLYSILADKGYFSSKKMTRFRKLGALLQGHPSTAKGIPGVEFSSGSLGHGLSYGAGVALSLRLNSSDSKTYVSISDAECQEGQTWEAAATARHNQLGNLCAIVDYNDSQIDGKVHNIMDVAPLTEKWKSFGWRMIEIDGHDYDQIIRAFEQFNKNSEQRGQPTVIISHNILGQGVSFMEDKPSWHHGVLTDDQLEQALTELGDDGSEVW